MDIYSTKQSNPASALHAKNERPRNSDFLGGLPGALQCIFQLSDVTCKSLNREANRWKANGSSQVSYQRWWQVALVPSISGSHSLYKVYHTLTIRSC